MKIVFLCGSLEPGCDGVGDYTRLLAGELIRRGHNTAIVSLNDRFIKTEVESSQLFAGKEMQILRLPSVMLTRSRYQRAQEWINSFNPEWLSLQYVPYSFHLKGVPFSFSSNLSSWGKNYSWHIMFHELWLHAPEKFGQRIVAFAQKIIIHRTITRLKPKKVNVSIQFNQLLLKKIGVEASVLKLFGNIPKSSLKMLPFEFHNHGPQCPQILYFGQAPRGHYLNLLLDEFEKFCKRCNKQISIHVVCKPSKTKDIFIAELNKKLSNYQVKVQVYGFLQTNELSSLMSHCTVGIVRSTPQLLGKSGTAIAMLEHGMPIWMPKTIPGERISYSFRSNLIFSKLSEAVACKSSLAYESLLPKAAEEFISELGFCNSVSQDIL